MLVFVIVGVLLLICGAFLLLTSSSSTRPSEKKRDLRASESIAVWTSSSEQDGDGRRDR